MPGIYFFVQATTEVYWALNQKNLYVQLIATGVADVVHVIFAYLFCFVLEWGFSGICWATLIHFVARFVMSHALINVIDSLKNKNPDIRLFSKQTTQNLNH